MRTHMHVHDAGQRVDTERVAQQLVADIGSIGDVTCARRLAGYALFEDGVMFGFVERDGTAYLRTSLLSARRFHALGATKHDEMPYWSIPGSVASSKARLQEFAYEAADIAHIAFSFGVDDECSERPKRSHRSLNFAALTLLAA